jgi:hydroxymethylbilane synthase
MDPKTPKSCTLKIGTRGSPLALVQARRVEGLLKAHRPDLVTEVKVIKTEGEKQPQESLIKMGGSGIFTKELDRALEKGKIDLAVHSLKDLPTEMHPGIELGAITKREAPEEALVSNRYKSFGDLPKGARIGTGSPRRKALILMKRPDLAVIDFRGNVETRLRKLDEEESDALVLARAGLIRLGLEHRVTEVLPLESFVPAPGQGALGVTIRQGDKDTASLVSLAQDRETAQAVIAERAFLIHLGGGCKTPMACHAFCDTGTLQVLGFVASFDGQTAFQGRVSGSLEKAQDLGKELAHKLMKDGADKVLEEI